jgi:hypothetical protein
MHEVSGARLPRTASGPLAGTYLTLTSSGRQLLQRETYGANKVNSREHCGITALIKSKLYAVHNLPVLGNGRYMRLLLKLAKWGYKLQCLYN